MNSIELDKRLLRCFWLRMTDPKLSKQNRDLTEKLINNTVEHLGKSLAGGSLPKIIENRRFNLYNWAEYEKFMNIARRINISINSEIHKKQQEMKPKKN